MQKQFAWGGCPYVRTLGGFLLPPESFPPKTFQKLKCSLGVEVVFFLVTHGSEHGYHPGALGAKGEGGKPRSLAHPLFKRENERKRETNEEK